MILMSCLNLGLFAYENICWKNVTLDYFILNLYSGGGTRSYENNFSLYLILLWMRFCQLLKCFYGVWG